MIKRNGDDKWVFDTGAALQALVVVGVVLSTFFAQRTEIALLRSEACMRLVVLEATAQAHGISIDWLIATAAKEHGAIGP